MQGAEVLTRFTADTKEMKQAEKEVQDGFERTKNFAEVAFAGAVAAIDKMVASFVQGGIEYNAQVETYLTRLTTLTGSSEKAHEILEQIKKDALATPFEVSSLTSAESLLLSTGLSAEQARADILALGDAISASGGGNAELSRMAVNLQQIKNVGKATALDIKQFAYAGIDIYGLLADSMGITREQAADLDVTYEMLSNALQNASSEGGKYYKAMEKQSTTYAGAMSNLEESVQVFKGAVAEGLFNALKDIIPPITEMFNWLTKNKDIVVAIAVPLLTFINIIAGFLIIKKISAAIAVFNAVLMANPIVLIIAAVVALVAAFIYLWNNCEAFRNFWIGLWNGIVDIVVGAWEWIKGIFNKIISFVSKNWKSLLLFLVNPFAGAFKLLYDNCDGFRNFINNFVNGIITFIQSIPQKVNAFVQSIIAFIGKIPYYIGFAIGFIIGKFTQFAQAIPNFITSVINWFKELPTKILEAMIDLGTKITNWFVTTKDNVINKTSEIINTVIMWFRELPGKIWNTLVETINNIKNWLVNMYNTCKESIKNLVNGIVSWFKKLPGDMLNIGKNIIEGLWNGIKNAKNWLNGKIKDFSKGILDGMKKALGIHSPSTEFAMVGKFSVLGYTEALDNMTKDVQGQIAETFGISPQMVNSSSLHYSPSVNVTTINNIEQDPLGRMVNDIKTFSGGAKNDYNYGMGVS